MTEEAQDLAKVEMLGTITGTRNGEPWPAKGAVIELPVLEAAVLVRQGMAKEVDDATELPEPDETGGSGTPEPPAEFREELEAKATELGIEFRSNISDATLIQRIDEAKAALAEATD